MAKKSYRVAVICILSFQAVLIVLFAMFVKYDSSADALSSSGGNSTDGQLDSAYPMFQDVHVMIFVGFGFLMTFLKKYGFSAVGLNFLIAAMVIQWALLCTGFFRLDPEGRIQINVISLMSADIAAAAVLISFGAVLGKVSPIQLFIMGIVETVIFAANEYVGTHLLKTTDAGGSVFVHTFGAYFGLTVSYIVGKGVGRTSAENKLEGSTYNSDLFSMIGTIFLWLFWPSFNAGLVEGDGRHRAVINTYLSISASCVTAFAISSLCNKNWKFEMVHIQNATLAGGVCVGTAADLMVQPYGALLIGSFAGILSTSGFRFIQGFLHNSIQLHDTCGVNNLHGMPGVAAGLIGALMAGLASEDIYGTNLYRHFPARGPQLNSSLGTTHGRTAGVQAGYQLLALTITFVASTVGGLFTGLLLRFAPIHHISPNKHFDDSELWHLEDEEECPEAHVNEVLDLEELEKENKKDLY